MVRARTGPMGWRHCVSRSRRLTLQPAKQIAMKAKLVQTIILPNVEAMITGVWRIDRSHDLVRLTYSDNTTEAAMIPTAKWAEILQDPFLIISEVQSKRTVGV